MVQVAAAVIFQNGKILVARRGPGEKHAGCWETGAGCSYLKLKSP